MTISLRQILKYLQLKRSPPAAARFASPGRLCALAARKSPDFERWSDPRSYDPAWAKRAELAAALIPDGVSILELGVGAGDFKRLVKDRCAYAGADLHPLDPETTPLNLDADPLPHPPYDYIVALGVFCYLHRPQEAARKIAAACNHAVISYSCVRPDVAAGKVKRSRASAGWVNSFCEAEFTRLFAAHKFRVASRTLFLRAKDFDQVVFKFSKADE